MARQNSFLLKYSKVLLVVPIGMRSVLFLIRGGTDSITTVV